MQETEKEKFYFDLVKECLKQQTTDMEKNQQKIARRTIGVILLALGIAGLFEVIKSLLVYSNIIYRVIAIKD